MHWLTVLGNIEPPKVRRYSKLIKGFDQMSNLPSNYELRNCEFNLLKSLNPPAQLYNTFNEEIFNPETTCQREWNNSASQEWLPL